MVAGTKVTGNFRLVRKLAGGHQFVIFGPFDSDEADQTNIRDMLYIGAGTQGAANVRPFTAGRNGIINPGEALVVQMLGDAATQIGTATAGVAVAINVIEEDTNTGEERPRILRIGDRATTGTFGIADNPTPNTSSYTDVLAFVAPDRKRWLPRGRCQVKLVSLA